MFNQIIKSALNSGYNYSSIIEMLDSLTCLMDVVVEMSNIGIEGLKDAEYASIFDCADKYSELVSVQFEDQIEAELIGSLESDYQ